MAVDALALISRRSASASTQQVGQLGRHPGAQRNPACGSPLLSKHVLAGFEQRQEVRRPPQSHRSIVHESRIAFPQMTAELPLYAGNDLGDQWDADAVEKRRLLSPSAPTCDPWGRS